MNQRAARNLLLGVPLIDKVTPSVAA